MKRAIGIVRVSQVNGRDGDSFASPDVQRERIRTACERDGLDLIDTLEELDVSGGKPLDKRPGLQQAVQAIEDGRADVVCAAYFDRLFRSLSTQAEVVERVEAAGGQVLAVDVGRVTNGSAGQWLSATMLGAVSEYHRRTTKQWLGEVQERAVARGALPWSRTPLGYRRREDGTLEVDPDGAVTVVRAFEMRAEGASLTEIRKMLAAHGVQRSHRGAQVMLANRVYLGEVRFGELINPDAHAAIIDRELFDRVQRMVIPRGRKPKSDYLLARLGILRCATCGARLSAMQMRQQGGYRVYRHSSMNDCPRKVAISADMVEDAVVEKVRSVLADVEGRASAEQNARQAIHELDRAQEQLDAATRALSDWTDPVAVERLVELRGVRDARQANLDRLGGTRSEISIPIATDWERLTLEERRAFIRLIIDRVDIAPGRGPDRISIHLIGE